MYLARLRLNQSRPAILWAANPYRVHQRLRLAYPHEPRLLFRIEASPDGQTQIIAQSHSAPDWTAFLEFPVLRQPPEHKPVDLQLQAARRYRFRLLANPTVKRMNAARRPVRMSLFQTDDQEAWLRRKLTAGGAALISVTSAPQGLRRSKKSAHRDEHLQTHFAVLFEGELQVVDPEALRQTVQNGIGSAKGYGFGLLSLAPS